MGIGFNIDLMWRRALPRSCKFLSVQKLPTKNCVNWGRSQPWLLSRALNTTTTEEKQTFVSSWQQAHKKDSTNPAKRLREAVAEDISLQVFLRRVYVTAGFSIGGSLALAQVSGLVLSGTVCFFSGLVLSFISSIGLGATEFKVNPIKSSVENSPKRKLAYSGLVCGTGLSLVPFQQIAHSIDPFIWPTSVGLAFGTTICSTLWVLSIPEGRLKPWRPPLVGGLVMLIVTQSIGILANVFYPESSIAEFCQDTNLYFGIGMFAVISGYSTYESVKMYKKGIPDHLGCAANIFLDFLNLLMRFAEAMARSSRRY